VRKQNFSFRDFLKTGKLGPISTSLSMPDVAKILGAPDEWVVDETDVWPLYWIYGPVEMSFAPNLPHKLQWFQIEQPGTLVAKNERLTSAYRLCLDGLAGKTKISDLLSAGVWDLDKVTIFYAAYHGEFAVDLCVGSVKIFFESVSLPTKPNKNAVRRIDRLARMSSIYSYDQSADLEPRFDLDYTSLTGRQYLDLLGKTRD